MLTENLEEVSIVSQRITYDHICDLTVTDVPFSSDLLKNCKLSHARYTNALELKKSDKIEIEKRRKRRIKIEEIGDVKGKKRTDESCIESMETGIKKFVFEAEKEEKLLLLSKAANSYRETVKGKKRTLSTLDETLNKLEDELHQLK